MLLSNLVAVVYGAAGPVGSAVASAYAREGAIVHLVGRHIATLEPTVRAIRDSGGSAHAAEVDVLDAGAVRAHADAVGAAAGIDIAFNAVANDDVQGSTLTELSPDLVLRPVVKSVTAHLHIATAVARQMAPRHSGVILAMAGGREAIPALGGAHIAWSALAGLCRQLAAELGPAGIRVAWILSPGSPDSSSDSSSASEGSSDDADAGQTLLGRRPSYGDVANAAVFLSSPWARTMTATELNITGGAVVD